MRISAWGKYDEKTGDSHHISHHCADVAACFAALAATSVIRDRLKTAAGRSLENIDIARLTALVFLHDCGKLHPGFQAKVSSAPGRAQPAGHVQQGFEIFAHPSDTPFWVAETLHVASLIDWGVDAPLLRAVISHHGRPSGDPKRPSEAVRRGWTADAVYDPKPEVENFGAAMRRWFGPAFESGGAALPSAPRFQHYFCGLVSLADWLGSNRAWFPFLAEFDPDYWRQAQGRAAKVIKNADLSGERQRAALNAPPSFAALTGFKTPKPQQAMVGAADLDERLLILEAETGSGKTEAALWRYAQLFHARKVDALYFAVPTRSAAKQLHGRVVKAAERLFGDAAPQVVLAVPGYIRAGAADGQPLPNWRVLWDDTGDENRLAARWAAESAKRFLAAQIAVGTVDQAMLAALMVKHAHLRGAALSRSLLVIDEVHASDAYMTAVQTALLDAQDALGGHAMLMSATLGSEARGRWLGPRGRKLPSRSFAEEKAQPYPALWRRGAAAPQTPELKHHQREKSVRMAAIPTMDPQSAATRALTAARAGARVLVIRNTVAYAKQTLAALELLAAPEDAALFFQVCGARTLHHSRFALEDRERLDAEVEAALGADGERPAVGKIVIGTQTLEQSLDIDADLLLTDLCPVDVLLQRIGRLHRHALPRPKAFQAPACYVLTPEQGLAPLLEPDFCNGIGVWMSGGVPQGVYRDLTIIELTLLLVNEEPIWRIPAMNRRLVEGALHPERIKAAHTAWDAKWADYRQKVIGAELAAGGAARRVLLDATQPFMHEDGALLQFPQRDEDKIRTRLGGEGAMLTFSNPIAGPFGQPIMTMSVPPHLTDGISIEEDAELLETVDGMLKIRSGEAAFRYDRFGLERERE